MLPLLALDSVLPHPYPLIRGGGLFLIFVGLGFLLGWIFPSRWIPFGIGGFIAGFTASGLSALLKPSLGAPSLVQIAALVLSFVVEAGLLYYVITTFKDRDDRTMILSILFVVGLHFIIMGMAHGPLIAVLGVVTSLNAWIGLKVAPKLPLRLVGGFDALLKIGIGSWMLFLYPALTYT
ncbi:DUF6609 family protein [Streptosporangium roseum]|uniref:DUF6609 family protein n=1 Tax=Streptosporangium roseum TaxID=2001 RepID=UPI0004CD3B07|nr:DUF6609 family protein [Streptosporangium roseum]